MPSTSSAYRIGRRACHPRADDDDDSIPSARARELQEQEAKIPEEELELIKHSTRTKKSSLNLSPYSIPTTRTSSAARNLFAGDDEDEDDDFGR